MGTTTRIHEIFEKVANNCIELQSGINSETNSYEFEKAFRKEMAILEQKVYQEIVSGIEGNKNERMQLMTSFGEISLRKTHPLAVSPGGFKISSYLQEQMCRAGAPRWFLKKRRKS